jgi:hypothetical protein
VYLLENVPSKSVRPISRSNRKDLAVHVSLSSIFTISKSRPRILEKRSTSVEAEPPKNREQERYSGFPAATLPYPESTGAAAARPRRSAPAGYMAGYLWVSTPESDKTDKNQRAGFSPEIRGFLPACTASLRQMGTARVIARPAPVESGAAAGNLPQLQPTKMTPRVTLRT